MTERLSKALQQLPTEEVEKVADFAEFLASKQPAKLAPERMSLDWVGAAAELGKEYRSGVDAAHAAADMMVESVERKLGR